MRLQEVLEKMVTSETPLLLSASGEDWEAGSLLDNLPSPKLSRRVHVQPGLYIAEINDAGYLGRILYKFKQK